MFYIHLQKPTVCILEIPYPRDSPWGDVNFHAQKIRRLIPGVPRVKNRIAGFLLGNISMYLLDPFRKCGWRLATVCDRVKRHWMKSLTLCPQSSSGRRPHLRTLRHSVHFSVVRHPSAILLRELFCLNNLSNLVIQCLSSTTSFYLPLDKHKPAE